MNEEITNPTEQTNRYLRCLTREIQRNIDFWSFIAGAILMLSFLAIGMEISGGASNSSILQEYQSPIFITLFIGVSSGHYLGLAFTTNSDNLTSVYIGGFAILWFAMLSFTGISPLSFALAGITFGIFLSYQRGIVHNNARIKKLMEIFGQGIAPSGIFLVALVEFILPSLRSFDYVLNIINYAENNPSVFIPIMLMLVLIWRILVNAIEFQADKTQR